MPHLVVFTCLLYIVVEITLFEKHGTMAIMVQQGKVLGDICLNGFHLSLMAYLYVAIKVGLFMAGTDVLRGKRLTTG